jgi:hypothetical protein
MTFQPVLPFSGLTGWTFLKRTLERQQAVQQANPVLQRDEAYFRDRIGKVATAEQLVADRRLTRIALTAFGLEGDVNSRAFVQKVLEGGTQKDGSLANKLANKQYREFSAAFGFGDFSVPRTRLSSFPDEILAKFRARSFETAVGAQNNAFRLALNAERELPVLAARATSETAKWYSVLGNAPLREVMQTALGLPRSFAAIDLDQQVATLRLKAEAAFGAPTVSQFSDPARMEALIRRFHIRSDVLDQQATTSPAAVALTLLRR